jgi:hypothetical protein
MIGLSVALAACSQMPAMRNPATSAAGVFRRPQIPAKTPPRASWVRRDVGRQPLLYITNANSVSIYSGLGSSALTLVGEIFGFQGPTGACTDAQGNIFVSDGPARVVDEFAYGSIVPENVMTDTLGEPYACAIDTASGRIAVTNLTDASGNEPGNVLVYPSPTGTPVEYSNSTMNEPLFCAFDRRGNLIVDAYDTSFDPVMAELRPTGKKIKTLAWSGLDSKKEYEPTGLEPSGAVTLWGDTFNVDIDQLKITGSTSTLVATLPLSNIYSIGQFITYGSGSSEVVIVPDYSGSRVQTYSYPQGTFLFSTTNGVSLPVAAVISHPQSGRF